MKQALKLTFGKTFVFRIDSKHETQTLRQVRVTLDYAGRFWLETDRGARFNFVQDRNFFMIKERQGGSDAFLDAFIIAMFGTPLQNDEDEWTAYIPVSVFPTPKLAKLLHLFVRPREAKKHYSFSRFSRTYDPLLETYSQKGIHKIGYWVCHSVVEVCDERGLRSLTISRGNEKIFQADVLELGCLQDNVSQHRSKVESCY